MGLPGDGDRDTQGRFLPAVNALGDAKPVIGIPGQRDAWESGHARFHLGDEFLVPHVVLRGGQ